MATTKKTPLDLAWDAMVAHCAVAARTQGEERIAARLAGREAFLRFEKLREAEDKACLARAARLAKCD